MRRHEPRYRTPARAWIPVVVVLMVLAGTAVWLLAGRDGSSDDRKESSPGSGADGTAEISHEAPSAPTPDGVILPDGSDQVDGHPVRFPATDLGAVATQVAIARAQIGFDYDQAARIAGIYAAPDTRTVLEERSRAAVAQRREQAGAPREGVVPPLVSYAVTPIAFTVHELDTGTYAVNLLSYVSMTEADGTIADFLYAGTQLFGWIDGDWKVVHGSRADLDQLTITGPPPAAAPGTAEYEHAGWIAIGGETP